jgi:hypothetical protein
MSSRQICISTNSPQSESVRATRVSASLSLLLVIRLVVSDALCKEVRPRMAIEVSADSRYLQSSDGKPFYIHSDRAWSLPRDYSREEVVEYLDKTLDQKFNGVQQLSRRRRLQRRVWHALWHLG